MVIPRRHSILRDLCMRRSRGSAFTLVVTFVRPVFAASASHTREIVVAL